MVSHSSLTSINKLQVMQKAALRTATGCTQDTNIQHLHDKTLTLPIHEHLPYSSFTIQTEKHNIYHIPIHKHTTYVNTPRLKKTLFSTTTTTQQTFPESLQQTCATYIHPPHISSSGEILPCITRRTLAQLRTNKSPFLKSYVHKVDAKTHPSPLCPLCKCNIHTHDTHHIFNCTHIRTTLSPLDL